MPELSLCAPPPRAELLRQLRERLGQAVPGFRLLAEGVLGADDAPIEFVGVDGDDRTTLVLVGAEGEDLALLARAVAQRAWLAPRLRDWQQLGPQLRLRPDAGVRAVLLCPAFQGASEAAAAALGEAGPELAVYRCVRNGAGVETLIERPGGLSGRPPAPAPRPEAVPAPPAPFEADLPEPDSREPARLEPFRTGLTDADLGLSAAEQREFE